MTHNLFFDQYDSSNFHPYHITDISITVIPSPYALNMWSTNVKIHSTLGRPLASFIFSDEIVLISTLNLSCVP